jgi:broad specificity phosphatase PhoE
VYPHGGLLDIDYGEWTGLTPMEAKQRNPELYTLWRTAPQQVRFPQGESLSDVQSRLLSLLEELLQLHSEQRVVLVGHLVVNRVLICTLLGVGLEIYWRIGQETCAVNEAHYQEGMGQVLSLNDTCHLSEDTVQGGYDV